MSIAVGARLSTTSEGLWLTAALAGITRLPVVLKLRPVGGVEAINAHPGMAVLEEAGVCHEGVLDPDVADWVMTLGRPDIELNVAINVPEADGDRLVGPPPVFTAPEDPVQAYAALTEWAARRPVQRAAALCRRDGWWVGAARMWHVGFVDDDDVAVEELDEIVVSALGQTSSISQAVQDLLGAIDPAHMQGFSIEADVLDSIVTHWQAHPDVNVVAMLADAGLSAEQARMIEVVGDSTTARATITALEHHVEGAAIGVRALMVADTLLGRVLVSSNSGPDGQVWTMVTSGTEQRIAAAINDLLESLPSGPDWSTHQRVRK
jgi:hypothetical protein